MSVEELSLSQEFVEYVAIVDEILKDITTSHDMARSFCEDPDGYIKNKGYYSGFDTRNVNTDFALTERDKKFLLALTDEDVSRAVAEKDIRSFIRICVEKEYFASAQEILNVPVMEYRKHFNSDADFEQFLNIAKVINGIDNTRTPIDNPAWFFMIPVVAIAVAAVELMVAVDQYVTIIGETRSTQDRVMKLWYDKNNVLTAEESLLFYDAAIIDRIDNLVYAAKSEYKNLNEDALRSFLIVNYVKYYGL